MKSYGFSFHFVSFRLGCLFDNVYFIWETVVGERCCFNAFDTIDIRDYFIFQAKKNKTTDKK